MRQWSHGSDDTTPVPTKPRPLGPPADHHRGVTSVPGTESSRDADVAAIATLIFGALFVTVRFWHDPSHLSGTNQTDQALFEWMFSHAARSVTHLENPFFSDRLGAPDGINIMGNTSVLALGVPLTPVTLLWGAPVTYATVITFGFAATGIAWYLVLSRYAGLTRLAAFCGAAFCAFSPGMLSHADGHPQIQVQFLLPIIAWRVFRLRTSNRPARDGVVLGALISAQVFIGEEMLLITAMTCAACVVVHVVMRRRQRDALRAEARPFLVGLAAAGGLTLVVVAYPLYQQFFGPRSYRYLPWIENFQADLAAYPAYSGLTWAGSRPSVTGRPPLAQNLSEMNAFFGWPMLLVVMAVIVWLRRDPRAQTAAIVAVVFAALSLGSEVLVDGEATGWPGPWWPFSHLPLFEAVVTTRFALVTAVAIGVLLALAVDRALPPGRRRSAALPASSWAWMAVIAGALVPLFPRPLRVVDAFPTPTFFSSGADRPFLAADGAVTIIPPSRFVDRAVVRWAAVEHLRFRTTNGRFLAPAAGADDGRAALFHPPTDVGELSARAAREGAALVVTAQERARALDDLRRKDVAIVVMPASAEHAAPISAMMDDLVGPGALIEDMWVWEVNLAGPG